MPRMLRPIPAGRARIISKPILTALMSVYNSSAWLEDRIRNLTESSLYRSGGLLIYCLNACSPDQNDAKILERHTKLKNFIYEVSDKPCTVYAAWNRMIMNTDTKFVMATNTDDLCAPNAFNQMATVCDSHNAMMVYTSWYTIGDNIKTWPEVHGNWNRASKYNPDKDLRSKGHFVLYRRALFDMIGLFDPSFMALGDADLWQRAWVNDIKKDILISSPLHAYRWRGEGPDGNLWSRVPEEVRTKEWQIIGDRKPGKLVF